MSDEPKIRTTQQTSKIWKAGQAGGCLLTILSVIFAISAFSAMQASQGDAHAHEALRLAGWVLGCLAGLCLFLGSRIAAWWFHG